MNDQHVVGRLLVMMVPRAAPASGSCSSVRRSTLARIGKSACGLCFAQGITEPPICRVGTAHHDHMLGHACPTSCAKPIRPADGLSTPGGLASYHDQLGGNLPQVHFREPFSDAVFQSLDRFDDLVRLQTAKTLGHVTHVSRRRGCR